MNFFNRLFLLCNKGLKKLAYLIRERLNMIEVKILLLGLVLNVGDVVDNLYKLKHSHCALISVRHRMSICPTVLLFQLTTRHIR